MFGYWAILSVKAKVPEKAYNLVQKAHTHIVMLQASCASDHWFRCQTNECNWFALAKLSNVNMKKLQLPTRDRRAVLCSISTPRDESPYHVR